MEKHFQEKKWPARQLAAGIGSRPPDWPATARGRTNAYESENHFLLKKTDKTRSHMIKMMVYIELYRKILTIIDFFSNFIKTSFFWCFPHDYGTD